MSNDRLVLIAKALADPQRLAILERIAREQEVACQTLVDEFEITQATISHHITQLVQAGLIASRKAGRCCFFRVELKGVAAFGRELDARLAGNERLKRTAGKTAAAALTKAATAKKARARTSAKSGNSAALRGGKRRG